MSTEFKLQYHNSFIDVEFPAVEEGLHARAQSLSPHRKGYNHDLWDEHDQERLEQEAAGSELCSLPLGKAGFFEPRVLEDPILHHFRRSIHFCWENRFSVPTRCQRCQRDQWCTPGKSWECWAPRVMPPPMPSFHLWLLWSWEQLQLLSWDASSEGSKTWQEAERNHPELAQQRGSCFDLWVRESKGAPGRHRGRTRAGGRVGSWTQRVPTSPAFIHETYAIFARQWAAWICIASWDFLLANLPSILRKSVLKLNAFFSLCTKFAKSSSLRMHKINNDQQVPRTALQRVCSNA